MWLQVRLRKLMIDMVLGTDMKQHVTIISRFQTSLQVKLHSRMMTTAGSSSSATAESLAVKFEDPADRSMLLQANLLPFLCFCFCASVLTAVMWHVYAPTRMLLVVQRVLS